MADQSSEFNKRFEQFFSPPEQSREEHLRRYRALYPDEPVPAYSPLYELRSNILRFRQNNQWFPAMIFAEILVQGLVFNITAQQAGDKMKEGDFDDFYQRFLILSPTERIIIRELRNAREHNFGQLLGRVRRSHPHFSVIEKYFQRFNKAFNPTIEYFKIAFSLSNSFSETASFRVAISSSSVTSGYVLLHAEVNPLKFIEKVELGVANLQSELPNNQEYRQHFLENLTRDNWMRVYYK